jgi:quercetin dioxygenase-like cupin family protein
MHFRSLTFVALAAPALLVTSVAIAADPPSKVTPAFSEAIANIPGKSLIAATVEYPPSGKSPPHHHAKSAFITGYVLSGAIRSQVDDGPGDDLQGRRAFYRGARRAPSRQRKRQRYRAG